MFIVFEPAERQCFFKIRNIQSPSKRAILEKSTKILYFLVIYHLPPTLKEFPTKFCDHSSQKVCSFYHDFENIA